MSQIHDNLLADALAIVLSGKTLNESFLAELGQIRRSCSSIRRALIARILAAGPLETALPWLILMLCDPEDCVAGEVIASIRELLPWTTIRPFAGTIHEEPAFTTALSKTLGQFSSEDLSRLISRLGELHGASREIAIILERFRPDLAESFKNLVEEGINRHYPPQITVAVTYRCNARCSYCYASVQRDGADATITSERFASVVQHASRLGFTRIGFTGGEPTMHPQFAEFVQTIGEQGMTAFLASNGMFDPALVDSLHPDVVGGVTAHIWFAPDFRSQCEAAFVGNLRRMHERGLRVMLRYNMVAGEPVPLDDLERIYQHGQASQINLAIAVPNFARLNRHVERNAIISESVRLLEAARLMRRRGMFSVFAKPLPACAPTKGDWRWLGAIPHSVGTCAIWQVGGTHNVLINPDGSIWPCIVLNRPICRFEDLESRQQLAQLCATRLSSIPKAIDEHCADCAFWKSRRCQGSCLAFSDQPGLGRE